MEDKQFYAIAVALWKPALQHVANPQQAIDLGAFGLEAERRFAAARAAALVRPNEQPPPGGAE